jgi:hypothetical protein
MGNETEGIPKSVFTYFLTIFLSSLLFVWSMILMVFIFAR